MGFSLFRSLIWELWPKWETYSMHGGHFAFIPWCVCVNVWVGGCVCVNVWVCVGVGVFVCVNVNVCVSVSSTPQSRDVIA